MILLSDIALHATILPHAWHGIISMMNLTSLKEVLVILEDCSLTYLFNSLFDVEPGFWDRVYSHYQYYIENVVTEVRRPTPDTKDQLACV